MSTSASSANGPRRRTNLTLWLVLAVCVAPFLGSYALYLLWRPSKFVNYGELLDPLPMSQVAIATRDGGAFRFSDLRGRWIFLMADSGRCEAHCRQKLYYMRQVRLTQGKDQERIERVWLVTDAVAPDAGLEREYQGTRRVVPAAAEFVSRLPAQGSVADHIYLVDPLGNLMMRYPRDPDPNLMKKDIARLLKVSSGWVQGDQEPR
jgi:cytochrome oxidase Cu insertion factor (SCO1/SenC/PrrC family)